MCLGREPRPRTAGEGPVELFPRVSIQQKGADDFGKGGDSGITNAHGADARGFRNGVPQSQTLDGSNGVNLTTDHPATATLGASSCLFKGVLSPLPIMNLGLCTAFGVNLRGEVVLADLVGKSASLSF